MSKTIASIQDLWKTFEKGGHQIDILKGINLDISSGDRISIVGKSGSGKSTLLHILGALEGPSKGTILMQDPKGSNLLNLFEFPPGKIDALRNQMVGFIFQFHHLLPDHNAVGNVMMPLIIRGEKRSVAVQRAENLLQKVGLAHRLKHLPGELSGGEQQRVAIARALVHKPTLLLADEPTGNLDPKTSAEIMELLMGLQEDVTRAMIMVTHDHSLAQTCSRRFDLVHGLLQEVS